jgi:20S proteasome subunit beta 6
MQTLLYGKRFFPYYVHTIIGGLDAEGKGAVYSFDPVGSYEREQCRAGGAAASLIMPFLDSQVCFSPRSRRRDPLGSLESISRQGQR